MRFVEIGVAETEGEGESVTHILCLLVFSACIGREILIGKSAYRWAFVATSFATVCARDE